jgi:hypothetical protein
MTWPKELFQISSIYGTRETPSREHSDKLLPETLIELARIDYEQLVWRWGLQHWSLSTIDCLILRSWWIESRIERAVCYRNLVVCDCWIDPHLEVAALLAMLGEAIKLDNSPYAMAKCRAIAHELHSRFVDELDRRES